MRYLTVVSAAGFVLLAMVFSATGLCQTYNSTLRKERFTGDRFQQRVPTRPLVGEMTDQIRKNRKMQIEQQLKQLRRQIDMLTLDEQIQDLNGEKRKLRFEQRKRQAEEQALLYTLDQQIQGTQSKEASAPNGT